MFFFSLIPVTPSVVALGIKKEPVNHIWRQIILKLKHFCHEVQAEIGVIYKNDFYIFFTPVKSLIVIFFFRDQANRAEKIYNKYNNSFIKMSIKDWLE